MPVTTRKRWFTLRVVANFQGQIDGEGIIPVTAIQGGGLFVAPGIAVKVQRIITATAVNPGALCAGNGVDQVISSPAKDRQSVAEIVGNDDVIPIAAIQLTAADIGINSVIARPGKDGGVFDRAIGDDRIIAPVAMVAPSDTLIGPGGLSVGAMSGSSVLLSNIGLISAASKPVPKSDSTTSEIIKFTPPG